MAGARIQRFVRDRDVQFVAAIVVVLGVLYGLTLCPTVYWYDSAEFAAEAVVLGVPHPPGYPLYTMIAHVFTWLPGEPALGVNIMSAVFGVVSAGLCYAACRVLDIGRPAAAAAALALGLGRTFWGNAVVAEVYTPGLAFTLGALLLLVLGLRRDNGRYIVAAAFVAGLGLGMHMSIATCGLGFVWLAAGVGVPSGKLPELRRPDKGSWVRRIRVLSACLGAAVLGACVFMYIPLRTFEGWGTQRDWVNMSKNIGGGTFRLKFLEDYDVGERVDLVLSTATMNITYAGLLVAAIGLGALLWKKPREAIGLVLAAAGNVYWFFNYNVPDIEVFYLPTVAFVLVAFAAGVDLLARTLARRNPRLGHVAWAALALPIYFGFANYAEVDLSEETEAKSYAERACKTLPKGAHIVMYSHPEEWRYFAVFHYTQKALGQCTEVSISRRSPNKLIRKLLRQGTPVYAFVPIRKFRDNFKVTEEGPLFRVGHASPRPRRPRRRHRPGAG